jgi:chromosome segregation ATPase
VQDVIEKVKHAERRAEQAQARIEAHEREAATLVTRVTVLETRYTDLKQTLDAVVVTQAQQGERLAGIRESLDAIKTGLGTLNARVWSGSAAGAGGTGAAALLIWWFAQRGG